MNPAAASNLQLRPGHLPVFLILMGTKFGVMVLTFKPTMDRGVLSPKDLT
jgi:hypothetical protein